MSLLARIVLFLLIQLFNVGIFTIGLRYLFAPKTSQYVQTKIMFWDNPIFSSSLYIHSLSAPFALFFVSYLVVFRKETQKKLHQIIGKMSIGIVLFLSVPSGIGLSYFARGGMIGKMVFFYLSIYTGYTAFKNYSTARKLQFKQHEQWAYELLVLLCSAIVLRILLAYFSAIHDWKTDNMYILSSLLSWLPFIVFIKWKFSNKQNNDSSATFSSF